MPVTAKNLHKRRRKIVRAVSARLDQSGKAKTVVEQRNAHLSRIMFPDDPDPVRVYRKIVSAHLDRPVYISDRGRAIVAKAHAKCVEHEVNWPRFVLANVLTLRNGVRLRDGSQLSFQCTMLCGDKAFERYELYRDAAKDRYGSDDAQFLALSPRFNDVMEAIDCENEILRGAVEAARIGDRYTRVVISRDLGLEDYFDHYDRPEDDGSVDSAIYWYARFSALADLLDELIPRSSGKIRIGSTFSHMRVVDTVCALILS